MLYVTHHPLVYAAIKRYLQLLYLPHLHLEHLPHAALVVAKQHAAYGQGSYVALRKVSVRNKTPKEKSAVGAKSESPIKKFPVPQENY